MPGFQRNGTEHQRRRAPMTGRATMQIRSISIDKVNGVAVRSIASRLLKAQDDDHYLIFIQKTDGDTIPEPCSCVSVVFR